MLLVDNVFRCVIMHLVQMDCVALHALNATIHVNLGLQRVAIQADVRHHLDSPTNRFLFFMASRYQYSSIDKIKLFNLI